MKGLPAVAVACLGAGTVAAAQPVSAVEGEGPGRTVEVWAGYATHSPNLGILGSVPGSRLGLVATRFNWRLRGDSSHSLEWSIDLIPGAMMRASAQEVTTGELGTSCGRAHCGSTLDFRDVSQGQVFGFGANPLGLSAIYRRHHLIQPRFGAMGGFLLFDRAVPTTGGTSFNFTATLEAGVQIVNPRGNGAIVVYRFHHLSNAGTGEENFGLASNILSIGARWSR